MIPIALKKLQILLAAWTLAMVTPEVSALEMFWELLPGRAKDIGVGADGSAWIVGSGVANGDIYRWDGTQWILVGGSGVFIAVGPQGDPWVVNVASDLFHRVNNQWMFISDQGSVTGVGVGADGTVLVAGGTSCFCGPVVNQRLYRYTAAAGFEELPGGGRAAVIEPDGAGWWVLNSNGEIFRWQGGPDYRRIEGHARDISRGANGDIWIVGGGAFETGNDLLFRWNGAQFEKATKGQGRQVSVGPDGTPWVVNDNGQIYRGHRLNLEAGDVTVMEGAELKFPVTLSYPSDRTASFSYQVFGPDNSVVATGSVSLAPGVTQRIIVQPTLADGLALGNRTYRLQLSNAVGADLLRAAAAGTVLDTDLEALVLTPFRVTTGGFAVRCPSRTGYRYLLQRRGGVDAAELWAPVTAINGTGSPIELGDSSPPAVQAFYRVAVSPLVP